jgi:hypothetical protein
LPSDFDRRIDALHIKRDAFLNSMIRVETPHLVDVGRFVGLDKAAGPNPGSINANNCH